MKHTIYIILFSLTFSSCKYDKNDIYLQQVLELSGENKSEILKVLSHYRDDSLKLEAAKFLITNMPYHYSFKNESLARSFYSKVDSVIDNKSNINEIEEIINELEELYDVKGFGIVSDLKIIKSDFLIDNIDRSFDLWQKGRWAKHLNFEQFCEYILPYKSEECQFLDNWREYLKDEYNDNLQNLEYCDSYKNSSLRSALVVNDNIRKKLKPMVLYYSHSPIRLLSTKQRMPYGICDDYTNLTVSIFRSIGIPIVYDYTPQWPFRSIGHAWNAVLCNNGKNVTFCGGGTTPGQIASYYDKMAKVYRKTYSANMDVLELKKKEKFVPDVFETPFMKDVTEEYMACRDIEIDALKTDRKYYYISVFNDNNWVPVDFAKPDGRKIKFESLGTDIVYLPVYYNDNGRLESFTDPVLLKPDGMRLLTPDTINKQTLILKRKYPVFVDVYSVAQRLVGGEFQASNDSDFKNVELIYRINNPITTGFRIVVPDTVGAYRYWRYYQPSNNSFCNISEISFNKDSCKMVGKIIGTDGSWNNNGSTKDKAFDGDLLTVFDAPVSSGAWVGMDFGSPVKINNIVFTGRGDGNSIEIGDLYELYYWDKYRGWKSLGKQSAKDVFLSFDNVPRNALFLLRDLSKGKEQRIFTYEDGEQVWW